MGLFYNGDVQARRCNILSEPLEVSKLLPASAQNLLAKLLVRNSKERLGPNGAFKNKAHPFLTNSTRNKCTTRI